METGALMAIVSALAAVPPAASVTWRVNDDVPAAVGVPLMTPVLELSDRPVGIAPPVRANVYGPVPPAVLTVWLYPETLISQLERVVEVIDSVSLTVIVRAFVAVDPATSATFTVKLDVPTP